MCVCVCVLYIFSILSSVDGLFAYFHTLAIVNNAAKNIAVHAFFGVSVFIFFAYILRNGIAGSYGSSIFNFWSNFHSSFHYGFTNYHSHQQYTRVVFSTSSPTFVDFFDSHSDRCEVISHCVYDLHFSDD